jgi:Trk-type K+ transport system membrane component
LTQCNHRNNIQHKIKKGQGRHRPRLAEPETRVQAARLYFVAAMTAVATFLISLQEELTLTSSVTAVVATLNDVGPGLGQVGATESFEVVNPFGRAVLTVCMLLGRLEIFTVLALFSPAFWKR